VWDALLYLGIFVLGWWVGFFMFALVSMNREHREDE
jgi:hypothetical protein